MKTIRLTGKRQADYATKLINECLDKPELWCVDIKKHKEAKTMQQLRALFGVWYEYLSNEQGETKDDLHTIHKTGYRIKRDEDGQILGYVEAGYGGWLSEIYKESPEGDIQEMWVDLTTAFGKAEIQDILKISLSWATIDQMREYMKRIEHYYVHTAGMPLPIIEQYARAYR